MSNYLPRTLSPALVFGYWVVVVLDILATVGRIHVGEPMRPWNTLSVALTVVLAGRLVQHYRARRLVRLVRFHPLATAAEAWDRGETAGFGLAMRRMREPSAPRPANPYRSEELS